MIANATLRLTNKHREDGGSWICGPENQSRINYVKLLCSELRVTEPENDWHVETRGTNSDWHRWEVA